jgi:U2-associated protein SR140
MEGKKIKEFPAVDNKLLAPTKKSLFEKQKAEQEAKRLREEAETAAVYASFVKSFDDEDDDNNNAQSRGSSYGYGNDRGGYGGGYGAATGPPKRHYGSAIPSGPSGRGGAPRGRGFSGPGSLGPPPPGLARKRPLEGFQEQQPRRRGNERVLLAFDDDYEADRKAPSRAFNTSDDEDERRGGGRSAEPAVPKPTLRLSNLPPATSPAAIKALLPPNLTVDAVRIMPSSGPGSATERKSMSAIVTLSKETAANDIDAAVNGLQNRYLGYGFYLSLHRHLSSAALSSAPLPSLTSGAAALPFGAKPVHLDTAPSHSYAPPGSYRGIAPPTSYAASGPARAGPLLHVPVHAPRDIKQLKLIHKTIENLLLHGPAFEALLMTRPEVQREEKWAWLWDARSAGGIWYRWRLWEVLTGSQTKKSERGRYLPLFEDSAAWKAPDAPLAFEYVTQLDEFVSDAEYASSSSDDSGDESTARRHHGAPPDAAALDDGTTYLNPLEKAKLTHLLARLPTSTGKLRKGDVARVTAFAIAHAGRGADEIVAAIVANIERPFACTSANAERAREEEMEDTSSASLIGLYLVSDILSSSSTSGVRHAWRYRQLFEAGLRARRTFEGLGGLERRLGWGRLRGEKWRRSVGNVLGLWEGWCVFPQEAQEHFVRVFNNPPVTREEEEAEGRRVRGEEKRREGRWKAVEREAVVVEEGEEADVDVDGMPMEEDVDGMPMEEDVDVDGVPMEEDDEDVDGEPMALDEDEDEDAYEPPPAASPQAPAMEAIEARPPRRRPKAEDMFADSGSEGE